jgi:hypothetical protein
MDVSIGSLTANVRATAGAGSLSPEATQALVALDRRTRRSQPARDAGIERHTDRRRQARRGRAQRMSTQINKAIIYVEWQDRNREPKQVEVQYNPTDYTLDKGVTIGEVAVPGLDAPLQQFVRGNAEKLTFDLFFDTTEHGMGQGAVSVTTETDKIYQLIKIEPERHAPPILNFVWSDQFPGKNVGGAPGSRAGAASAAIGGAANSAADRAVSASGSAGATSVASTSVSLGNQRREGFRCVMESIKQKFTLFSPDGVPLRATLTVSFRQYYTLGGQIDDLKPSSPDRTHLHVLSERETLAAVSQTHYQRPDDWRAIAMRNGITDPRRINPGMALTVPPLT